MRRDPARRHHRLRRGRAGRLLGRDGRGRCAPPRGRRRRRCSATTRSRSRRSWRGSPAGTARRARRWRSTARSTTGSASARAAGVAAARAPSAATPPTSYTIGIDSVEGTADRTRPRRRLRRAQGQGRRAGRPRAAASRPREHRRARCASTATRAGTLETARELMPELLELGVEFVEQPFPAEDLDALPRASASCRSGCRSSSTRAARTWRRSRRSPPTPTASTSSSPSAAACARRCGWSHAARALGLRVMLGCMIESELGIAPAAQLGRWPTTSTSTGTC